MTATCAERIMHELVKVPCNVVVGPVCAVEHRFTGCFIKVDQLLYV